MNCPICKHSVAWEGNPFRPFCSERCQRIDLDNWLEGRYRVAAPMDPGEEEAVDGIDTGTEEQSD